MVPVYKIAVFLILLLNACAAPSVLKDPAETDAESAPLLRLKLESMSGEPVTQQTLRIRPVFETSWRSLNTDADGLVTVPDLTPGLRYVLQVNNEEGHWQRWFIAGKTPTALSWVLSPRFQKPDELMTASPRQLRYFAGLETDFASALAHTEHAPIDTPEALNPAQDVLWLVAHRSTPDFSTAELEALEGFLLDGGALIINGEWAGFAAANTLDKIYDRLGIGINNTLAQPAATLPVTNLHPHPLTTGLSRLELVRSGQVQVGSPYDQELAFAAPEHYVIQQQKPRATVMALSRYGKGQIFCMGDSSLWQENYFSKADHKKLWENVLRQVSVRPAR